MSKYHEDLEKLFNFATHNDNGQKGVNDYILEELRQSKLNLEELVDKATPKKPTKVGVYKEDVECPHCKAGYLSLMRKCGWGNEYTMFNHCGNCGKALDWSKND